VAIGSIDNALIVLLTSAKRSPISKSLFFLASMTLPRADAKSGSFGLLPKKATLELK
jgi:hypothetical protein